MKGNNNSGDRNSGNYNSGDWNSGYWNSGDRNSGDGNPGDCNSGDWNSGDWNSGDYNSGNYNSGDYNSGDWNSGNRNSGDWNSGYWNSGYRNSGNRNSGNRNSGNWNSGDYNSGYFNTNKPRIRIFNEETNVEEIDFPDFFYFDLTEWIQKESMTDEEKKEHPEYKTTGGYLKTLEYKDAWRKAWDNAKMSEKRKVLELPNWNNEIFKEITGIDVEKELKEKPSKMIKIGNKKYSEDTIKEALRQYVE